MAQINPNSNLPGVLDLLTPSFCIRFSTHSSGDQNMTMATKMSTSMVMWGLLVVFLGLSTMVKETQAQCAGSDLTKLNSCLSAAKADVPPSAACCQALGSFQSNTGEACLCAASTDPRFTSSGGKVQYAILIPQKCNLRYKAGFMCNGVLIPGGQ